MRNTTSTTWRSSATSTLTATMPSLVSTVASRTKSKLLFRKPRWVSNRAVEVATNVEIQQTKV
ncbi:unnamed protein product [Prunus armeniaca]